MIRHELAVPHEQAYNLVTGSSTIRRYNDDEIPTEEELKPKIPFGFRPVEDT